jgi:hypothetical protein
MHLPKPFFKLPRHFDAERLRAEVAALPADAWAPHPNGIAGNSSVRLISADGGENDRVDGEMRPTTHLASAMYVRQLLASFAVPWSRTRLLRLAPGAGVPVHADINYHWFYRVRVHIPVITRAEVRFYCDGESVHMAAGDAWVFDNWRLHHVANPTSQERVHLVADTTGSAAFWQLVGSSEDATTRVVSLPYRPGFEPHLLTERNALRPIMNPAELELLVGNMRGELLAQIENADSQLRLVRYHGILDAFVRDWRQFYVQHGEEASGWTAFRGLRDSVRAASRELGEGLVLRTNRVAAHQVLEGRVLRACLAADFGGSVDEHSTSLAMVATAVPKGVLAESRAAISPRAANRECLARPIFIIAAPRSGSTLLFETLASSEGLATLGGEAHWLIETIAELCPGAPGVDSNRLLAAHATPPIIERIQFQILNHLVDRHGAPVGDSKMRRFLEKTPKNALRIPFLEQIFPDARFVFLWREPRGNLSSIMEAWRSGNWRTYPTLDGFALPWSMLLPPGWEAMRGRALEELAAFQWQTTNRIALDDLSELPAQRWTSIEYAELIAEPGTALRRLCTFAGLAFDSGLEERVGRPLPEAKHTLTSPDPHKWKSNEAAVTQVLASLEPIWSRLQSLSTRSPHVGSQSPNL